MPSNLEKLMALKGMGKEDKSEAAEILKSIFSSEKDDEESDAKLIAALEKYKRDQDMLIKEQNLIIERQNTALESMRSMLSSMQEQIKNVPGQVKIPKTDLSKIEGGVSNLSKLFDKLEDISDMVAVVQGRKPDKVDFKPVLDAVNGMKQRTKKVEFQVETDEYDFPVKVIATETYV